MRGLALDHEFFVARLPRLGLFCEPTLMRQKDISPRFTTPRLGRIHCRNVLHDRSR